MKLLHIVSSYPPYKGGMGNVVFEEVRELAERGHEVHVATLSSDEVFETRRVEEGVHVHRLDAPIRWGKAGMSPAIVRLMQDTSFDAVHLHVPFFGVQELAVFKMWTGWQPTKLVLTYHMDIVASGFVGMIAWMSRLFFLGALVKRSQAVVVAAYDYAKTSWLELWWKYLVEKIVEAPFGVDIERFHPSERPERDHTQLMFLGGLDRNHYFKGLEVLLRALSLLRDRTDWKLIVVGDGDLRAGYERQVRQLNLEDRVTFLGREIGKAEQHYRESDVFVFPSIDRSEAFGLVALEAQASGTPVVASDLDGVRVAVADGETGKLVSPRNPQKLSESIAWMIDNPDERKVMGERARARIEERFTWKKHVDMLENLYRVL